MVCLSPFLIMEESPFLERSTNQYAALDIYWNIFSSTATDFYDEEPQVVAFMMNTFLKRGT